MNVAAPVSATPSIGGTSGRGAPAEVLLGLGANLGRPVDRLRDAVKKLGAIFGHLGVSSLYRSAPVGFVEQPDFFNLVCRAETGLAPESLLRETLRIERELGRERTFPNAPRTIDIDILAYGAVVCATDALVLPHPRMHLRAFVLVPLDEIAPEWRHPTTRLTARGMLRAAGPLERVERVGGLYAE